MRFLPIVAIGGVCGALLRYGIDLLTPDTLTQWFSATLLINLLGCVAIGALGPLFQLAHDPHPMWRPFFAPGVLGGFTTFSAISGEVLEYALHDSALHVAVYVALTLTLGIGGVVLGHTAAQWSVRKVRRESV